MNVARTVVKQIAILAICLILASIISKYVGDSEFWLIKQLYAKVVNVNPVTLINSSVPIVDYGYYKGTYVGPQINAITVSDRAITYYNMYKSNPNNQDFRNSLVTAANWLVVNAVPRDNYSIYEYKFPWPTYNLIPPWHSGMAQGKALQALVDAHEITHNDKYLATAKRIVNSFFVQVDDGGVTYKDNSNGWWYEEYANKGGIQSRVLNGMMFALLGIHDYYTYTGDLHAKFIFDKGVTSLKDTLHLYDDNGYSNYDILHTPAGVYHNIHIELLNRLFNETGEIVFKNYRDRWQNFKEPYSLIQQASHPTSPSFLVLAGNFVILASVSEMILFFIKRWKWGLAPKKGS